MTFPIKNLRTFAGGALLLGAGLVFIFGWGIYRREARQIRSDKYAELRAIAGLKAGEISASRSELLAAAGTKASGATGELVLRFIDSPGDKNARAALLNRMGFLAKSEGYGDMLVLSTRGRVLLSLSAGLPHAHEELRGLAAAAVSSRAAVAGDFYFCRTCGGVNLEAAAPVNRADGRAAAVIVIKAAPERFLLPLMEGWPLPSRTGETQLLRRAGGEVLVVRRSPAGPVVERIPATSSGRAAVRAAVGVPEVFEGRDYSGVKVIYFARPVPGTSWFLLAKVDAAELLSEARYRAHAIAALAGLGILLSAAFVLLLLNERGKRLYRKLWLAERERHAAREEVKATLYGIGDGVISTDKLGRVARINPVAEALTGWREAEALGRPLEEVFRIINEDTRAEVENPAARVLREGGVIGLANHTMLLARDGTERPIADSGAPVRAEDGAIIGVVLVFRDQSAERAARKALDAEREQLDAIIGSSPVGLLVLNESSDIVRANTAVAAIAGVELKDVPHRPGNALGCVNAALDPRGCGYSAACALCPLREALAGLLAGGEPLRGEEIPLTIQRAGKEEELWLLVGAERIMLGGRPHAVVSLDDITGKKKAEAAEERSRSRYAAVFGRSPIAIEYFDGEGALVGANEACIELFGVVDIAEIAGFSLFDDPNITEEVKDRLRRGEQVYVEAGFDFEKVKELKLYRTTRSGRLILDYHIAPMLESGKKSGYVVQIQDITARKAAETRTNRRAELLSVINSSGDLYKLMRRAAALFQGWTGCEAVGVRLKDGADFPYFETRGFPEEFVKAESSLCSRGPDGQALRDRSGNPVLECMCGNVLQGHFDPALPFFTSKGSFWTNSITALLASSTEADRQARTRNRCNGEGYESVALVQLRSGVEVLGLLQFNSKQKGRFDAELISFLEDSADQVAVAVAHLKAEEALRKSETRLLKAQGMASVGNWEIKLKTGEVWASEEARRIYNFSMGERLTLESVRSAPLPDYREKLDLALRELSEGKGDYDLEFELKQANSGAVVWVRSKAELVLDENGEPLAAGVLRDITAEKQAAAELRARETKFSEFFRNMTSGVAMYTAADGGKDFTFADINPAGERMSQVKREAVLGRRLLEIFPEAEKMGFLGLLREVWRTGEPAYLPERLYQDGRLSQWVENRIIKLPSGEVVAIYDDVTERKKLEAERLELVNTIEKSLDEIYVFDAATLRFEYANNGALKNIGYSLPELKQMTPADIKPEFTDVALREKLRPLAEKRAEELVFETTHRRKDGTTYPAEVHAQFSQYEGGGKFSAFIMDITERRAAEDSIKASLAEKEVLLKEIHHRVKNNLQVVSSLLNLQAKTIKDAAAAAAFRESRSRVHAMALVHETLYRSRDLSLLDMREYMGKLLDSLRGSCPAGSSVAIEKKIAKCSLSVDTAVSIGLILNELVSNSLKHAFADGRSGTVRVTLAGEKDGYRLEVADDGPGLPADYDLKRAESLGMQLVGSLAKQISGTVEAVPGRGARFVLRFPG